jgi:signal transduction histidine kinase
MIARPLRRLTRASEEIASGAAPTSLAVSPWTPTEIQTLSAALARMTTTLRERADYIAAFAANVSHELKTPLTGIRGAAELLLEQWRGMSDQQRERFVANIDADAQRMERLVTRLLVLARVEHAGEPEVELDVREVLHNLCARHPEAQVSLSVAADVPARYRVVPDHFTSAVGNLLDNAVRHGAGKPIDVRARRAGERLCIEVQDRGPGISAANQSRVFTRFFTTERDSGGTGLGLTIVEAIANRRGGSVRFATGPAGTTFTVVL